MMPSETSSLHFSVSVPAGWRATSGDSALFSPVGRPDVVFAVVSTPANGVQTTEEVFTAREQEYLKAGPGAYEKISTNSSAPLGGQQTVAWEFNYKEPGSSVSRHAIVFGVMRGDHCLTVESWWPASEEDLWTPILQRMRSSFPAFTE